MALKPTPRARRLKRQRDYANIYIQVKRGELKISPELMQSINSRKWKAKIAEAAIMLKIHGPDLMQSMAGRGGKIMNYYPEKPRCSRCRAILAKVFTCGICGKK